MPSGGSPPARCGLARDLHDRRQRSDRHRHRKRPNATHRAYLRQVHARDAVRTWRCQPKRNHEVRTWAPRGPPCAPAAPRPLCDTQHPTPAHPCRHRSSRLPVSHAAPLRTFRPAGTVCMPQAWRPNADGSLTDRPMCQRSPPGPGQRPRPPVSLFTKRSEQCAEQGWANPAYRTQSLQTAAKEYAGTTEIELNELLKRFVVRQSKAARRSAVPGPNRRATSNRSWRFAAMRALRSAGMPDYLCSIF